MRIIYGLLLLLINPTILSTQTYLTGTVINANTKAPIPFVSIGIQALGVGTVSDEEGVFSLKGQGPDYQITFSSIGYQTVQILSSELKLESVIALSEIEYTIPAIEIKASRFNGSEKIFGVRNETRGPSIGFGSNQLGAQIGALIAFDQPTYVKSANFVINHAKGDSMVFRVNIYAFEDHQVRDNMLQENLIIRAKQKKGTITIDLTPYNLVLEQEVLLSLEWIKDDNGLGNMGLTFDMKKAKKQKGVFVKKYSVGDFEIINKKRQQSYKPCFYFIGKQAE